MWISGPVSLGREIEFRRAGGWVSAPGSWGPSPNLTVAGPGKFLAAFVKAAATGYPPGWAAVQSAFFAGLAALCLIDRGTFGASSFALNPHFPYLKDFNQTSLKGSIGAALGLLEAEGQGYPWTGHWEDAFGMWPSSPDFLIYRANEMVILEAKGTEAVDPGRSSYLKSKWLSQVEPHLAWTAANDGWLIATSLSQITGSTLIRLRRDPGNALPPNPNGGGVPLLVRALGVLRGLGCFLGWRVNRGALTAAGMMPDMQVVSQDRELFERLINDKSRQTPDGLHLGAQVSFPLAEGNTISATTFCNQQVLLNLLRLTNGNAGGEFFDGIEAPRVDVMAFGVRVYFSDGSGVQYSSQTMNPERLRDLLLG